MFHWCKRIILIFVLIAFIVVAYLLIPVRNAPAEHIVWGVTFTKSYAEYLGLDWQQAYLAALDDLRINKVRIGINWDEIEPEPGRFDFSDYDWMFDEAEKRGVTVVPAIGFKLPRWPECRAPGWAAPWLPRQSSFLKRTLGIGFGPERKKFEQAYFEMLTVAVSHFKERKNFEVWQVENEGFIGWFGDCPPIRDKFIRSGVEFVRGLDARPILMTESGELSSGIKSARVADILGTSLYREVWSKTFGFLKYPLPPSFYARKARLLRPWVSRFIITELQLEAWAPKGILNVPVPEQLEILGPEELRSRIEYARATGIDEIYGWGVEWWWWLKLKGYPQLWEVAREEFSR